MKKYMLLLFVLVLGCEAQVFAQRAGNDEDYEEDRNYQDEEDEDWDDGRGFDVGITLGAYFANKQSANLYNGSCGYVPSGGYLEINDPSGVKCHSIMERLTLNFNTIKQINDYYGSTAFEGPYDMHPVNMTYQPAFQFGAHFAYKFSAESGVFFEFSSMRVKTVNQFTLRFIGTSLPPNAQEDVRLFQIWAEEDRFQLKLGYAYNFYVNEGMYFFTEIGASMLGVKVRENKVNVAETDYELFVGSDNPNQLIYYRPATQVGYGIALATGMKFEFDDQYSMHIGLGLNRDKVKIFNYSEKLWNFSLFGRFSI